MTVEEAEDLIIETARTGEATGLLPLALAIVEAERIKGLRGLGEDITGPRQPASQP